MNSGSALSTLAAATVPPVPATTVAAGTVTLRADVVIVDRYLGGRHVVVLHDTQLGKFFHAGSHEGQATRLIDGHRSLNEIWTLLVQSGTDWTLEDLRGWVTTLVQAGLAEASQPATGAAGTPATPDEITSPAALGASADTKPATVSPRWQVIGRCLRPLSLTISQRFPLGSADGIAVLAMPVIGPLLRPVALVVWCVAAAICLAFVASRSEEFSSELQRLFSPATWPLLAGVWVLLKIIHELGHAIAAKQQNVRVGKYGILFFLFAPIPYVDVTAAWKLQGIWSRVRIALAGVYLEGWTAILATAVYACSNDGLVKHIAAQWMLLAGPATWLVNANPLLRLDGYYALSDLTNIPNLRMHGRSYWVGWCERLLLGLPRPVSLLAGWRRGFAASHAVASILFQFVWMGGLVIAVSQWGGLLGMVLATMAVLLWCLVPLLLWAMRHWSTGDPLKRGSLRVRLIACGGGGVLLTLGLLAMDSPVKRSIPVMVQYRDEQIVRASTAGFVETVAVASGQWVQRGDLLLVLRDDSLQLRYDQTVSDLTTAELRQRQSLNRGEIAAAEAQNQTILSLRQSRDELQQAMTGLRVVAQRHGVVVTAQLDRLAGRYVTRGETLLRVADPADKELLLVFPESDWASFSGVVAAGDPLTVRLRGGQRLQVTPQPALPRFADELPSRWFAGSSGGDIPVIAAGDQEERLRAAFPVGEAVAVLGHEDSQRFRSGQRGRLYMADSRSILQRLWIGLGGET